jgi:hypothetical protein
VPAVLGRRASPRPHADDRRRPRRAAPADAPTAVRHTPAILGGALFRARTGRPRALRPAARQAAPRGLFQIRRLFQIKQWLRRLLRVASMDWMHLAKLLALATGGIVLVATLVVGTMVWFLNHPKD